MNSTEGRQGTYGSNELRGSKEATRQGTWQKGHRGQMDRLELAQVWKVCVGNIGKMLAWL